MRCRLASMSYKEAAQFVIPCSRHMSKSSLNNLYGVHAYIILQWRIDMESSQNLLKKAGTILWRRWKNSKIWIPLQKRHEVLSSAYMCFQLEHTKYIFIFPIREKVLQTLKIAMIFPFGAKIGTCKKTLWHFKKAVAT